MKATKILNRVITLAAIILCISAINVSVKAEETTGSSKPGKTYLNSSKEYIHLGKGENNSFQFVVKKSERVSGSKYQWYIVQGKGDPNAVSINKNTGKVIAKSTGKVYIRCKITLPNNEVIRQEAEIIVRNNITKVDINNGVKNQTIEVGQEVDFNRTILKTEAGNASKSSGITRWEITKDTAGVGTISKAGKVLPIKQGSFVIRAVCFQSTQKYNLWLKDKKANVKYVTAASKNYTVKVISNTGEVTVATQAQLGKVLTSKEINDIKLLTDETDEITIAPGKYTDKTLSVSAPKATIHNYAAFKSIAIEAVKGNLWSEHITGNVFRSLGETLRVDLYEKEALVETVFISWNPMEVAE